MHIPISQIQQTKIDNLQKMHIPISQIQQTKIDNLQKMHKPEPDQVTEKYNSRSNKKCTYLSHKSNKRKLITYKKLQKKIKVRQRHPSQNRAHKEKQKRKGK